ncbi:MAG: type II secretion system protein N [Pseudomonadales bacterium]
MKWLIVIGIAYTLAMTVWVFFETPVASPVATPSQTQTTQTERGNTDISVIVNKNLFGVAGAAAPTQQQQTTSVTTRLPLELQSVFVADEAERSTAIVAQKGKPGRMYRVGDDLPGNAELVEVAHDQIYLRRAGVRESLPFPKSSSRNSFQAELVEDEYIDENINDGPPPVEDLQENADAGNELLDSDDQSADEPTDVATYREQFNDDAAGTLDELGIETADGGGYRIGNSVADKYLQQTGLQTGDVILSINGQPVGDIQQDRLQLDSILAQGAARIEVQRGSRRFFVTARIPN